MGRLSLFGITLLSAGVLLVQDSRAQDYTGKGLPEGALARLSTGSINDAAYSPDGTRLAAATSIGIRLYDAHTGAEVALLTDHTDEVTSVAFSPDGSILASGSEDNTVRLWDVATGQERNTLTGQRLGNVTSVAFSPDGRTIASGGKYRTVRLWDVVTGQEKQTLTVDEQFIRAGGLIPVTPVSFSPGGRTLASGGFDSRVRLWDVSAGELKHTLSSPLIGYTYGVLSVAFSPGGSILASGSADKRVRLWDVATGQVIRTLTDHAGSVYSVSFSPDGQTLASGSYDATVRLWDVSTGQPTHIFAGHTGSVNSVSFSPDGQTLASGSSDSTILLWDVSPYLTPDASHKAYTRWGLPDGALLRLGRGALDGFAFTPDGQWLTLSSSVGIWYYDAVTGAVGALQADGMPPSAGVISPDTSMFSGMRWMTFKPGMDVLSEDRATLASAMGDTIRVRDTATGEIRFEEQPGRRIQAIAYRAEPFALAAACGDSILVWREGEEGAKTLTTLRGHADDVRALAILPDGPTLASASIARIEEHSSYFSSGEVRLWDLAGDRAADARTLVFPDWICCLDRSNMVFSRDGSTLAAGGNETIYLWDVNTGNPAATLYDDGLNGTITGVAFSPDRRTVASRINTFAGHIRLWDIASGTFKDVGSADHISLEPIGFSQDPDMLVTQSHWENHIRNFEHEGTTVFFFDSRTGQRKNQEVFDVYDWAGVVKPVRSSPDLKTLAVGLTSVERGGATSGVVKMYDVVTGRSLWLSHEAGIDSVAFSPYGDILVSWMRRETADARRNDKTIRLWDVATGELLLAASADTVTALRDSATARTIATVSGGNVRFAGGGPSMSSPQVMTTAEGESAWVSPDWSVMATVSNGAILLWDM